MTVTSTTNKVKTLGNGITTNFAFTFKVFATADITVSKIDITTNVETIQILGVDYTVTLADDGDSGGTVIYIVAPTSNEFSFIIRELDYTQETDFPREGKFPEEDITDTVDKNTMLIQQTDEKAERSLQLPADIIGVSTTLPLPDAGKALLWNATADALENSIDDFNDIVTDATAQAAAAAASAAAASTSEGNAATSESNAAASAVSAAADAVLTAADVVSTNADVVSSAANAAAALVSEGNAATSETNAAASAAAADVAKIEWQGAYNAGTGYVLNDAVTYLGSSFINIQAGTGQTPAVGGTAYWDDLANKGDAGTGDMDNPMTTQGDIITGGASGVPARLGIGTALQVLQTNAGATAPEWADAGGGGAWNLLSTQVASASSSIDFTSNIDSTYDAYVFVLSNLVPSADFANFRVLITDDGGSTFETTLYYHHVTVLKSNSTSYAALAGSNSTYISIGGAVGNAAGEHYSGVLYLHNPANSSLYTNMHWHASSVANDTNCNVNLGSGQWANTNPVNGIRFKLASGNINSGTIRMYGISNS